MKKVKVTIEGTDLTSRKSASIKRKEISEIISSGHAVSVDLSSVIVMSQAYADELFAILYLELGIGGFTRLIKLDGASESVLKSIAITIKRRVEDR